MTRTTFERALIAAPPESAHECIAEEQLIELVSGGCDRERALRMLDAIECCADCHALMLEAIRASAESSGGATMWSRANCATEAAHWEPGTLIANRYRIVRRLGSGGMGDVYEASDTDLTQPVALKTIAARFSRHETSLERLKQEVRLARRVVHPNVCRVLEFGRHRDGGGDRYFLTMELLHGELLSAVLRREGRLAPHAALKIVRQVAEGLRAIHAQNIVHRDVKASNIQLIAEDVGQSGSRRAVLLDFGIARSLDPHFLPLTTHGLVGTPDYMAPEQLRGEAVSPATDVYALGLVLFELLCGQLPPDVGRGRSQWRGREAPATWPPGVPAEIAAVIRWCLAPEPSARPQTMAVLLQALERSDSESAPSLHRERPHRGVTSSITAIGAFLALALATTGIAFSRCEPETQGRGESVPPATTLVVTEANSTARPALDSAPASSTERPSQAAVLPEGSAEDDARRPEVPAREAPPPRRSASDAQRLRCSPPYYYDEQGIRIYRKECL